MADFEEIKKKKTTASSAWSIGCFLTDMKKKLGHGNFLKFIDTVFPFSRNTASKYMRLYERFKDDPSVLENMGVRAAFMQAGIIAPEKVLPDTWHKRVNLFAKHLKLAFSVLAGGVK
jgi:hypothetical protein